ILFSASVVTAWKNENLRNWDQGWSQDIFGEPLDPKTACDGEPCIKSPLIKPMLAPIHRNSNSCRTLLSDRRVSMCDRYPKNATLVSNEEFARLTPAPVKPNPPQDPLQESPQGLLQEPPVNQTLQKRSRWVLDIVSGEPELYMWEKRVPYTYSVAADPSLSDKIPGVAAVVESAIRLWSESCDNSNEPGHKNPFFDYWSYDPSASKANIWFYIAPGTVCDQPAAIACAFFPKDYPTKRTTVMINYAKLGNMKNKAILIMAHEIGHLLGLAHEEKATQNERIWTASDFDSSSIMVLNSPEVKGITESDCLAMDYYFKRTPETEAVLCKFDAARNKNVCTKKKAILRTVSPKLVEYSSSQSITGPNDGGHDELLMDTNGVCLGSDISQYFIITPKDDTFGAGWVTKGGLSFNQCGAIRVPSDPDFIYALQSDGNFVSYNLKTGKAVAATGSTGLGTKGLHSIVYQNDGNLVIYDRKGKATWSSGTYQGSGQTYRLTPTFLFFKGGHMSIQGFIEGFTTTIWGTSSGFYVSKSAAIFYGAGKLCLGAGPSNRDPISKPGTKITLQSCVEYRNNWNIMTNGKIIHSISVTLCRWVNPSY
ncbi:hypothetical protein BGW38_007050, partial [Lunasporangiospora selenospora]